MIPQTHTTRIRSWFSRAGGSRPGLGEQREYIDVQFYLGRGSDPWSQIAGGGGYMGRFVAGGGLRKKLLAPARSAFVRAKTLQVQCRGKTSAYWESGLRQWARLCVGSRKAWARALPLACQQRWFIQRGVPRRLGQSHVISSVHPRRRGTMGESRNDDSFSYLAIYKRVEILQSLQCGTQSNPPGMSPPKNPATPV